MQQQLNENLRFEASGFAAQWQPVLKPESATCGLTTFRYSSEDVGRRAVEIAV